MKIEWKVDVSLIVASLVLSLAAVSVAKILAPKRYVPMPTPVMWSSVPTGLYLDTEKGNVSLGPLIPSAK